MDKTTLNVLQLAIGFLYIFFAFNSQGFIEQTVLDTKSDEGVVGKHAGYVSLSIIYTSCTIFNFLAAPMVNKLGTKPSLFLGALFYALFLLGFLFINTPYLYLTSATLGLGAGLIWIAQGKYIAMNSNDENSAKHSNLFWAVSQCCIAAGGLFLYCMFRDLKKNEKIDDSKIRAVYGTFTAVAVVGAFVLFFLRMPEEESIQKEDSGSEVEQKSIFNFIKPTLRVLFTKRMLLAALCFAYTGLELAFWSGIYPTCISFTKKLGENTKTLIAFNAIAQGLGQFTAGLLFGILGSKTKKLGRVPIVVLGATIHVIVFIFVYLNFPSKAPLDETEDVGVFATPSVPLAVACGYFLAFGDACWNTQIFSFLVEKYNKQSAEAFSLFKFFQSLTAAIAFLYGTSLRLEWHLLILVITGVIGLFGFIVADRLPSSTDEIEADSIHID